MEGAAADAELFHALVVVAGQGHDAAHVVVDEAHVQALGSLFLKDVEDGIPHDPGLDDEVFEEDEALGLFKLFEQGGEELVPEAEILCLCPAEDRGSGAALKICRLQRGLGRGLGHIGGAGGHGARGLTVAQQHAGDLVPLALRRAFFAEEYVHGYAEKGQEDDGQYPGYLERGASVLIYDVDDRHKGEGDGHRLHSRVCALEIEQRGDDDHDLQQHEERHKRKP